MLYEANGLGKKSVAEIEEKLLQYETSRCAWCEISDGGTHNEATFVNKDAGMEFHVMVNDGSIGFRITGEHGGYLTLPIRFCPMCGRKFDGGKAVGT